MVISPLHRSNIHGKIYIVSLVAIELLKAVIIKKWKLK